MTGFSRVVTQPLSQPSDSFLRLLQLLQLLLNEIFFVSAMDLILISFFFFFFSSVSSQRPQITGTFIDCGATVSSVVEGRTWMPDFGFVSGGTPLNLTVPDLLPILSTVRSFPFSGIGNRKSCYTVPILKNRRYLVRTTYFYGGEKKQPVFDQIVDGTFWSVVNTTEDREKELVSYYEGVFVAAGRTMSLCLASNNYTDSDLFISALEFVLLDDSLYNSTDFSKNALSLISRNCFGYNGSVIRYPDDRFDRLWEPFGVNNPISGNVSEISTLPFWNLPPERVFDTGIIVNKSAVLEFEWPLQHVPDASYYVALYFASGDGQSRVFNISINGETYYADLNVTRAGVTVFCSEWPLSGATKITLIPTGSATDPGSGSIINAGEVFGLVPFGGRTAPRDVIGLNKMKGSWSKSPEDWYGDPCLPSSYSWTGIQCSDGQRIRVVSLNLTNMGISGSLSPFIANLTALSSIYLGGNSLSGPIPDLSSLRRLEIVHLEDNQFSGEIPPTLGGIGKLKQLFLQGNNLTGQVPTTLFGKPGLILRTVPGNHLGG